MDDLSFVSYCSELLTPWDVEDEPNFDLGLDSDEIDERNETYHTAVDDDEENPDRYWNSDENDKSFSTVVDNVDADDNNDVYSEESDLVEQSGGMTPVPYRTHQGEKTTRCELTPFREMCHSTM